MIVKEAASKLCEKFKYGLLAHHYYKKGHDEGYEKGFKDAKNQALKLLKKKYDIIDIDQMCDDVAKEFNEI
jgi:hypothetical protein